LSSDVAGRFASRSSRDPKLGSPRLSPPLDAVKSLVAQGAAEP
jgi:hypothetical protein